MTVKKKILIITQWFDPEPAHKGLLFAKKLKEKGFDIEVITGFPNYPKGRIYDGYNLKIFKKERIDNIVINRVFLFPSHNNSSLERVLNYLSFNISTSLYGLLMIKKPDIIYAYHPPITVGISAILLKYFFKVPLVYDVQDLWPDTLKATGMIKSNLIIKVVSVICQIVYKLSNKLIVLSPGFKETLIQRGVNPEKINIIYNWSNIQRRRGKREKNIFEKNKFNIIFAGNIGKAQALEALIESADLLHKKKSLANFVIIGDGVELENLKNLINKKNLNNVILIPRVSPKEIVKFLENADALIVLLKKKKLFEITIPSKTQAYMSIGKPIIMAVEGDAAHLIKKARCGLVCKPEDPIQLTSCIERLINLKKRELSKLGENGFRYYSENLSMNSGINRFADVFNSLL